MKRTLYLFLSCLASAAFAQGPAPEPTPVPATQTLGELYREAAGYDATLAAARADYEANREKPVQARGALLPSINASANTTWNQANVKFFGNAFPSGPRSYNAHGYALTLDQPLFNGQAIAGYREARALASQAQLRYEQARQDLVLRVADAYFAVLLAQDTVAFTQAQKQAIAEQLKQAKRAFEVGTATITDTNEAQARYDQVTAQEIAARNDLEVKQHALATLVGAAAAPRPLQGNFPLAGPEPATMDAWVARARSDSLAVKLLDEAAKSARAEVSRQRAGRLPTLDLIGSYNYSRASGSSFLPIGSETTIKTVGVQLQWPLFQGGAQESRVREALANRDKAQDQVEGTRRNAALSARQAYLGVVNAISQVRALQQALQSARVALDSNRKGLQVGVRTEADVLNAQQQFFNTKRDLAQARYQYLMSRLQLRAAVGELNEHDLAALDTVLAAP